MADNIYDYLKENFNIETDYKFKRDYIKNPLYIDPCGKKSEKSEKDDLIYLYITLNISKKDLAKYIFNCSLTVLDRWFKIYNISKDTKLIKLNREKTMIKKYGVSCSFNSKTFLNKRKDTWIKKYGVDNPSKSKFIIKKMKSTCIKKYGCEWSMSNINILNKSLENRLKDKKYKQSKEEIKLFNIIKETFPDVVNGYKSEKYPFICDFYIPTLDLYIEYQGDWTHGPNEFNCHHPYDENNKKHIECKNILYERYIKSNKNKKFYLNAIDTWTRRDVIKRNTAKINNLNYLEFFNYNDVINWVNTYKNK